LLQLAAQVYHQSPIIMSFVNFPSAGQAQVRQIAAEVLSEFPINPITLSEKKDDRVYKILLTRLAQNSTVQADLYTGSRIVEKEVANSYFGWLTDTKRSRSEQMLGKRLLPLDFNRMDFHGSVAGSWEIDSERKIYEGGMRNTVTARAVLTLAKGDMLYSEGLGIEYLINSRIVRITGGNHRLLAYKLLGIADLPTENLQERQVSLYEDLPNEPLNQALLRLESLCVSHDPRLRAITGFDGQEELVLQLAGEYQPESQSAASFGSLYNFVKEDLAEISERSLNRPGQPGHQELSLTTLADYARAYQHFAGITTQTWLRKFVKSKGPAEKPSYNQQAIFERLTKASKNNG